MGATGLTLDEIRAMTAKSSSDITQPIATHTVPGEMSAADKTTVDEVTPSPPTWWRSTL